MGIVYLLLGSLHTNIAMEIEFAISITVTYVLIKIDFSLSISKDQT